jgi:hypothetical protein
LSIFRRHRRIPSAITDVIDGRLPGFPINRLERVALLVGIYFGLSDYLPDSPFFDDLPTMPFTDFPINVSRARSTCPHTRPDSSHFVR